MNRTYLKYGIYALLLVVLTSCAQKQKKSYDEVGESGLTVRTEYLRANLPRLLERGTLVGHAEGTIEGIGWRGDSLRSDMKSCCNEYPAMVSYNLTGIEKDAVMNSDSVRFSDIRKALLVHFKRGGVNVLTWNAPNPFGRHLPTAAQTATMLNENSATGKQLKIWTKKLAAYINTLHDAYGIKAPVMMTLFPLSSPNNNDGWWKSLSPDVYKMLFRQTQVWLKAFGVNNALFIYARDVAAEAERTDFFGYYPGGDCVDAVQLCYLQDAAHADAGALKQTLQHALAAIAPIVEGEGKMLGLNVGMESIPQKNWWTAVVLPLIKSNKVNYLLIGPNHGEPKDRHFYAPYPGEKSVPDFVQFLNDASTLFMNDVNGLYLERKK